MPAGMWRGRRGMWRSLALAAVVAVATTGCITVSSGASTGGSGGGVVNGYTTIFVQKFRYHGMPRTMKTGLHMFLFENRESFQITHEMIPIQLPAGKTVQNVIDDAKAKGPDSEDEWLHIGGDMNPADTGASVLETLFLPPGNYAVACWQTGTPTGGDNGPPHAAIGMAFQFRVTP
jgi:hypothetical protein